MANFDAPGFNDPAPAFPTTGIHYVPIKYTNGSTVITASDELRLCRLPKNALIIPELCHFFTNDVDPDSGANLTVALKITDGTTTKTIIAAQDLQAINIRVVASAASISALEFFKTGTKDFYAYLDPGAGDIDASAEIFVVICYTMDVSGRYEVTS